MAKTLFFHGEHYLDYGFPGFHPLSSKRLRMVQARIEERGILERDNIVNVEAHPVPLNILRLFHTQGHIDLVKRLSEEGRGYLDHGDTPAYPGMYEDSLVVVGASIQGVEAVWKGTVDTGFQCSGGLHHARPDRSAGFCIFNDIGVGIAYLFNHLGAERILYVDIDAHHGDGVFYSFYDDPRLWIGDIHQDGRTLYPGTGFEWERGEGEAEGTKLNIPLPPGASDKELLKAVEEVVEHGRRAEPEMILLQAGADCIEGDPITWLRYSLDGHLSAVKRIHQLAEEICDGKLLVFGGGGYNLENTAEAWANILDFLSQ
jgi:acetoin utilization protein AcuC